MKEDCPTFFLVKESILDFGVLTRCHCCPGLWALGKFWDIGQVNFGKLLLKNKQPPPPKILNFSNLCILSVAQKPMWTDPCSCREMSEWHFRQEVWQDSIMQVLANCACAFSVLFHPVSVIFLSKTNFQQHMLCLSMTLCAVHDSPYHGSFGIGWTPVPVLWTVHSVLDL